MIEDDLKFGILYLQWLLYRVRLFVSHVKRSYKVSEEVQAFAKAMVLKGTLQNSSTIADPEEDQEERNEGDAKGGYANKEHLTMAFPLNALEEKRWNSMYCNIIVQSHLMLSRYLGAEELSNLLWFSMLTTDWSQCSVAMCRSQLQSIAGNKTLYINVNKVSRSYMHTKNCSSA